MASYTCLVRIFTILILFYSTLPASWASHVVGGNLEMVSMDKVPGRFRLALNLYFDEINQNVGGVPEADALIYIYRKSDNKRITYFYINYATKSAVTYANQVCATTRKIKTTLYRYEGVVNLVPNDYDDPGGYYMTWQYCCRNGDIDNIHDPYHAGQTFYLEFPPLLRDGKNQFNSSPVFGQVNGEFICASEPFYFSFDATDSDGDELRYSMATPLDRLDPALGVGSRHDDITVTWLPGYGPENAIPGTPPLTINRQTGELTVTANRLGLFVFTVVVEEFRRGQRIGLVKRDYQLLVVDCPPIVPPDPTITINTLPLKEFQFCEGKTALLQATTNASWEYQWQKDGRNIPGATSSALTVSEGGNYQLTTSLKTQCSKSRRSGDVLIHVTTSRVKIKPQSSLFLCGPSGIVKLEAPTGSNLVYQWYFEGKLLPDNTNTLSVQKAGNYWAIVRDDSQGCQSISDTLRVALAKLPEARLTPQRATTAICSGDSLVLGASVNLGYSYQWAFNGIPVDGATSQQFMAHQAGQYTVTVTDTTSCQATGAPFNLMVETSIAVTLDSIPLFCGVNHPPVQLIGYPDGGIFSGPGVSGSQFDPSAAGIGMHSINYTVNSTFACQNGTATQKAIMRPLPSIMLGPDREVGRGSTIQLHSGSNQSYQFQWTPGVSLNDSTLSDPEATPLHTTSYALIATDAYGCTATDSIVVFVYERVWIPDAFSPNGDGLNDRWELQGIESYPQAEVTIFNRWGETVFFAKGYKQAFDGHLQDEPLPLGVYVYQIKLSPTQPVSRGSLMILK